MESKADRHIFVTVIIPAYNSADHISSCLDSLMDQTYPEDDFEVIVVDNGSTDNTVSNAGRFPVKLLVEDQIKSPYAARNRGLEEAAGDVIALLDANKIPAHDWIETAVKLLLKTGAFLLGGKVEFKFSEKHTLGEIYDSITYFGFDDLKSNKTAIGGNLFFRREVLEKIGLFPHRYRSGMDMLWTRRAIESGFTIVHKEEVKVYYRARSLKSVLRKAFRVGKGHAAMWKIDGLSGWRIVGRAVKDLFPSGPDTIRRRIRLRGREQDEAYLYSLWLIDYISSMLRAAGRLAGYLNMIFLNKTRGN